MKLLNSFKTHRNLWAALIFCVFGVSCLFYAFYEMIEIGLMMVFTVMMVLLSFGAIFNYARRLGREYRKSPIRRLLGL